MSFLIQRHCGNAQSSFGRIRSFPPLNRPILLRVFEILYGTTTCTLPRSAARQRLNFTAALSSSGILPIGKTTRRRSLSLRRLLDREQDLAWVNCVAFGYADRGYDTVLRGLDLVLHLHRLYYNYPVAFLNSIAN